MSEMSPQEAAAVWIQVPQVEQQLTRRAVGLSNILTGLAIATLAIPWSTLLQPEIWAGFAFYYGSGTLILLFLGVRRGLWGIYGSAKPDGRALLYRYRAPGSWKWLTVDWWYLAAFLWGFFGWFLVVSIDAPGPVLRSTAMIPLFLTVYTLAGGLWERRQTWSRRPYLLALGMASCAVAWGLHLAGLPGMDHGLPFAIGIGWILAGTALYHQV